MLPGVIRLAYGWFGRIGLDYRYSLLADSTGTAAWIAVTVRN